MGSGWVIFFQMGEFFGRGAGVDRLGGGLHGGLQIRRKASRDQAGGGVDQYDVARRACGASQYLPGDFGTTRDISARQGSWGSRGDPEIGGGSDVVFVTARRYLLEVP